MDYRPANQHLDYSPTAERLRSYRTDRAEAAAMVLAVPVIWAVNAVPIWAATIVTTIWACALLPRALRATKRELSRLRKVGQ